MRLDRGEPCRLCCAVAKCGSSFRLAGGRLDYVNNRDVAVLVYDYNKHVINLFVWPVSGKPPLGESVFTRDGYYLVHWADNGMTFWAVSDAGKDVLRKFCDTIKD